jgi:hypothetical protein
MDDEEDQEEDPLIPGLQLQGDDLLNHEFQLDH